MPDSNVFKTADAQTLTVVRNPLKKLTDNEISDNSIIDLINARTQNK